MKTNIITINLEKLSDSIINFRIIYNEYPKYIIMNENTERLLAKQNETYLINAEVDCTKSKSRVGVYEGIAVAIHNALEDGEIDLV